MPENMFILPIRQFKSPSAVSSNDIIMKQLILLLASLVLSTSIQAQSNKEHIVQHIRAFDVCKSVAITQNSGSAMIYDQCEWIAQDCPHFFTEALYETKIAKDTLQDIHITELGRWIVLYNANKVKSDLLYENLNQKIASCQEDNEKITTITFNDNGDWVVVTTKQVTASSNDLLAWIIEGCQKYGQVWTACITEDAAVVVYESGFKFHGNVPENLKEALRACKSNVYTVKLSGSSWLFRCTNNTGVYSL